MRNRGFLFAVLVLVPTLAWGADAPAKREPPKTVAQQIQELRATVEVLTAKVQQLEAQNKAVLDALNAKGAGNPAVAKAANAGAEAARIARAVAANDIVIGMTKAQAEASVERAKAGIFPRQKQEEKTPDGGIRTTEEWEVTDRGGPGFTPRRIYFVDGIVVSVDRWAP